MVFFWFDDVFDEFFEFDEERFEPDDLFIGFFGGFVFVGDEGLPLGVGEEVVVEVGGVHSVLFGVAFVDELFHEGSEYFVVLVVGVDVDFGLFFHPVLNEGFDEFEVRVQLFLF